MTVACVHDTTAENLPMTSYVEIGTQNLLDHFGPDAPDDVEQSKDEIKGTTIPWKHRKTSSGGCGVRNKLLWLSEININTLVQWPI